MREATGGAYLWMIVIILIFIFAGYICFSINYTSAEKVTNSVLTQIQNDEGFYPKNVNRVLTEAHYRSQGDCNSDEGWQAFNMTNNDSLIASTNGKGNYCIKKILASQGSVGVPEIYYYRIKVFYTVDVPLVNAVQFNVKADSVHLYSAKDDPEFRLNIIKEDNEIS